MFERLREEVTSYRERRDLKTGTLLESGLITAASAGTAGSIAAVITTPIDVVKTRIMLAAADSGSQELQPSDQQKISNHGLKKNGRGLVDAAGNAVKRGQTTKSGLQIGREVMRENGVKGLWRGGALRGIWTFLGSGLYLGTYESGRIWLGWRRGETIDAKDLT
jgi:solute carrier family 25 S-adenosylmethionine transporter 26